MIRSAIDLGTNTCLLLVVECEEPGRIDRVVWDSSIIVRLGQGVDQTRQLHPEAMERTLACLHDYADQLEAFGGRVKQTICVSTASARDAQNGAEFFKRVEMETGFQFKVISGDEEARLTFRGALPVEISPGQAAVIDIGGGSTEVISAKGGKSLNLGSVRFTERFLKSDPVTDEEFWACRAEIDRMLAEFLPGRRTLAKGTQLVAVAGTATTLAAWQLGLPRFDAQQIDQAVLTRGDVHRMVEELKWRSVAERKQLKGIEPKRADVLLAGALILWRSLEVLDFPEVRISTRGLRFGLLL